MPRSRTTKKNSRTKRSMSMNEGMGPPRVSSPAAPTSSSASRVSSSSRSDVLPTRNGSSATTAPELTQRGFRWGQLGVALAAGLLAGFCFPPFDLGPVIVIALGGVALDVARRAPDPRRALRLRVRCRLLRRRPRVDPLLRSGRDRAVRRRDGVRSSRSSDCSSPAFARRGIASPLADRVGVGRPRSAPRTGAPRRVRMGGRRHRAARSLAGARGGELRWCAIGELRDRRAGGLPPRPRARAAHAPTAHARAGVGRGRRPARGDAPRRRDAVRAHRDRPAARRDAPGRRPGALAGGAATAVAHRPPISRWPTSCTATTTSSCSPKARSTPTPISIPTSEPGSPTSPSSTAPASW